MPEKNIDITTGWKVRGEIGFLSIENPPENWLEKPEFVSLDHLKDLLKSDPVKGLVIHGIGRHFSAGASIEKLMEMAEQKQVLLENIHRGHSLLTFIENFDMPVIAAIRGACFGGGLEVALATHVRICSRNALFAFPESNSGMMPGLGGTVRTVRTSGFPASLKMILGGDILNAEEALGMHLTDKITNNDPVEEAFLLLKKMTTDKPLKVIRSVMQALRNASELSLEEALQEETKLFCALASEESARRKSE
jgi:enoyl-CoA hydratase